MFKQFLNNVVGADVYMVTSFLIFFIFFIGVCVWLFTSDKNKLNRINEIPLKD